MTASDWLADHRIHVPEIRGMELYLAVEALELVLGPLQAPLSWSMAMMRTPGCFLQISALCPPPPKRAVDHHRRAGDAEIADGFL